jgi:hypothetical protein
MTNVVDGKPQFLNRTFAEYFTARWFSKNFQTKRSVLEHIFFDRNYRSVSDMFDLILAKDLPSHCAMLQAHHERFKALLEDGSDVNVAKKCGRPVMNLSAAHKSRCIFYSMGLGLFVSTISHYVFNLDKADCVLQ